MKFELNQGATSVILLVFIQDSSSTTGAGLGSLDENSGITGGYVRRNGTGVALAVDENVTTEGTYQAPSAAGKVRIGTPANMPTGFYELHFHNNLFAAGSLQHETLTIGLSGAANMAPIGIEIQLDNDDWANYPDGRVCIKSGGAAGTVANVNGTLGNPSGWVDGRTIANARGVRQFLVLSASRHLSSAQAIDATVMQDSDVDFSHSAWKWPNAFAQNVSRSVFRNCTIYPETGETLTFDNAISGNQFHDCEFIDTVNFHGRFSEIIRCALPYIVDLDFSSIGEEQSTQFIDCHSRASTGEFSIRCSNDVDGNSSFLNFQGNINLIENAALNLLITGNGRLTLTTSACTGGTVEVAGMEVVDENGDAWVNGAGKTTVTEFAAAGGGGGAGGGGTTIIAIASTVSTGQVSTSPITAYYKEGKSIVFAVVDSDGIAIDLSGDDIIFTIEGETSSGDNIDTFSVTGTVGGASNNEVTVVLTATPNSTVGEYIYSLRNSDNNDLVLARGKYYVVYAAFQDIP